MFSSVSHLSHVRSPNSMYISILLLQPLKVRISQTHFHLVFYSHSFSLSHGSLPVLGEHFARLQYSAMLCQNSISYKFMNKPPTPLLVFAFFLPMWLWLSVQRWRLLVGEMNWDLGTEGKMDKGRRVEGGIRRRSLLSFDQPPAVLAQSADTQAYAHTSTPVHSYHPVPVSLSLLL